MDVKLFIYSALFILTGTFATFGIKLNQYYYQYDSFLIVIFYMNLFFAMNLIIYLNKFSLNKLKLCFKDLETFKKFSLPAIIYTTENVLLCWCVFNVPLSMYIIGRTSTAFFNVPFSIYYLDKKIGKLYYCGLIVLLITYALLLINFNQITTDAKTIFSVIIVFLSGLTSTAYNNIIEKHLSVYKHNKSEMTIFYQIVMNLYGFVITLPIALVIAIYTGAFDSHFIPNFIFSLAGLCSQSYFLFKMLILSYSNLHGNQILAALDLFRRVITNILAYTTLNEYYNAEIIGSNICMFISFILIIASQYMDKRQKFILLEDLDEIEIDSLETIENLETNDI